MIENVLHRIGGVGMFGIISICIFFAFFSAMLVWAFRLKKSYITAMRELPLESESAPQTPTETNAQRNHE
jgi:hypothetical protein